jgi:hypothetical protein
VTEPASGQLRHRQPESRSERCEDEGDAVASTVGRPRSPNVTVSPEAIMALVIASVSPSSRPFSKAAIRKAAAGPSPISSLA